jgi:hypothetical protein
MLILISKKAAKEEIKKMSEEYDDYIKVVVDTQKEILAGGGERHFDGEQLLLNAGSKQVNLWGGGVDLASAEIDYNSIINLRPNQDNPSRDILSIEIRSRFDKVVKKLIL